MAHIYVPTHVSELPSHLQHESLARLIDDQVEAAVAAALANKREVLHELIKDESERTNAMLADRIQCHAVKAEHRPADKKKTEGVNDYKAVSPSSGSPSRFGGDMSVVSSGKKSMVNNSVVRNYFRGEQDMSEKKTNPYMPMMTYISVPFNKFRHKESTLEVAMNPVVTQDAQKMSKK